MTYDELVAAIESTSENTFDTPDMDRFIALSEQKIYNSVLLPALRKNVTGTATSNVQYLTLPDDFNAMFSIAVFAGVGAYTYLLNKDVDFIREAYPTPSDTGMPVHYGLFDENTIILGPTPDGSYTVEMHYFYYPESIVTAGTSWLGEHFDSALFNACMVEANRFMKGEEDLTAMYADAYKQAITLLKNLGNGKLQQDTYRSGVARTQVV